MNHNAFPGNKLRERRESLGVSVFEAYRELRIPVECIEALERGDLSELPKGSCYAIGFIRTYCVFLELSPDAFIDAFSESTRPVVRLLQTDADAEVSLRFPWLSNVVAWATVCAILALGWLTYTVIFDPASDNSDNRASASRHELQLPADLESE